MDDAGTTFHIAGRDYDCPLHLSLAVLTGKWKGLVIWFLYEAKTLRYGQLKRKVNEYVKVSDKMLIASLRELERDGLIEREIFKQVPPRVDYALTKAGRRAVPIIKAMEVFGNAYEVEVTEDTLRSFPRKRESKAKSAGRGVGPGSPLTRGRGRV